MGHWVSLLATSKPVQRQTQAPFVVGSPPVLILSSGGDCCLFLQPLLSCPWE